MACDALDLQCKAGEVVSSAAGDVMAGIARSMVESNTEIMKLLVTAWVPVPSTVDTSANTFLSGSLSYIVAVVAVASLLFAAGQLAIRRASEPAGQAALGIVRLVFVTTLGLPLVLVMLAGGDKFSTWIIDASTAGDPAGHITALSAATSTAFAASGLQMIVAVLGIIGVFIQIGLLMARSALLVVLVAFWPIAAAASITPAGDVWFKKLSGWLAAVVLYKPVAAIIYAAAFKLMDPTVSTSGLGVIEGVILILMACIALPALMRFFVPAVAAAGGGKGAGAAAAGLATGALTIGAAAASGGASLGASGAGAAGGMGAAGSAGGSAATASTAGGASGAGVSSAGSAPPVPVPAGGDAAAGERATADGSGAGPAGAPGAPGASGESGGSSAGPATGGDGPGSGAGGPTGSGSPAGGEGSAGDAARVPAAVGRAATGAVAAATGEEES